MNKANNVGTSTTKNILKMMYDGKIRKITDKCLLLPDNSLFNLETNEIIALNYKYVIVKGYTNNKFIYVRHGMNCDIYNVSGKLILKIHSPVKPRIEMISSCEYILVTKRFVYVYNSNIEDITKQLEYTNIFVDTTHNKVEIAYIEDDNIRIINLDIKM